MNTLGLIGDTSKKEITSRYNTFCTLCRKKINKGETCYSWAGNEFIVHLNCNDPEVKQRIGNVEFRKNVKRRKPSRPKAGREPGKSTPANLNNNIKDKERLR